MPRNLEIVFIGALVVASTICLKNFISLALLLVATNLQIHFNKAWVHQDLYVAIGIGPSASLMNELS